MDLAVVAAALSILLFGQPGRGARAIEGYPMLTQAGRDITWDEINVGTRSMFAAAGFAEVSHPTPRRIVMRIDFS